MNDPSPILRDPTARPEQVYERTTIGQQPLSAQSDSHLEELKAIQDKLKTLTDQVALITSTRESAKENMPSSENVAPHESEIIGLKETVNDLKTMVGEIRSQLPSKWESQGTVTDRVGKSDRGTDARKVEIVPSFPQKATVETLHRSKTDMRSQQQYLQSAEKVVEQSSQRPPLTPAAVAEKPTIEKEGIPERAVPEVQTPEKPLNSSLIIRKDSVHDFSDSKNNISKEEIPASAIVEHANKPRSASECEERPANRSAILHGNMTREFDYKGGPGMSAKSL